MFCRNFCGYSSSTFFFSICVRSLGKWPDKTVSLFFNIIIFFLSLSYLARASAPPEEKNVERGEEARAGER